MSASTGMGSTRRRVMPGMASQPVTRVDEPSTDTIGAVRDERLGAAPSAASKPGSPVPTERRAGDYGATQLASFRLPVDLVRRFQALVRESEDRYPRLRKQNLTELVIALLEEGPQTADEVAEMIRRKRLAEHGER